MRGKLTLLNGPVNSTLCSQNEENLSLSSSSTPQHFVIPHTGQILNNCCPKEPICCYFCLVVAVVADLHTSLELTVSQHGDVVAVAHLLHMNLCRELELSAIPNNSILSRQVERRKLFNLEF